MDAFSEMLYLELRQTEKEIKESLCTRNKNDWLQPILEQELTDIKSTINKLENGNFGQCEISGELIPGELLKIIPTLKTKNEFQQLDSFYRKSIN